MNVEFKRRFEKDLEDIVEPKTLARLENAIDQVRESKTLNTVRNLERLSGKPGYYRIRIGDYRIGLKLVTGNAVFLRCLHRREIYRYFP